ncbi:MAG: hypothetical protein KGJ62_09980 [Armatimonadetes bacterium]|nr:hypothetical protein [Armatimonadota bacterium]MDE2207519.1 hypothetical protein [Armatimonadota bacterium]
MRSRFAAAAWILALLLPAGLSRAQVAGTHLFNPYSAQLQQVWSGAAPDRTRLIAIGPLKGGSDSEVAFLIGGKNANDYQRSVVLSHWDGSKFSLDESVSFLGAASDTLLIAHLRTTPGSVTELVDKKGKQKKITTPARSEQLITTEGIYEWNGHALLRLFAAPPQGRLALVLGAATDAIVCGDGDKAAPYEIGATDCHLSNLNPPHDGSGYVEFGMGTEAFPGSAAMSVGETSRFVQSYWSDQYRWYVCVKQAQPGPDGAENTPGDQVVVMTPRLDARTKSFWACSRDDLETTWTSVPLNGHVLDVAVGDARNDGKPALMVLTAENHDLDRKLYLFEPPGPVAPGHYSP